MRQRMDDPEVGRVCLPSSPLRFTDAPALKPSPFLNQHEEELLGGFWVFGGTARGVAGSGGHQYGGAGERVGEVIPIAAPSGATIKLRFLE
jgi:hypothetical protein